MRTHVCTRSNDSAQCATGRTRLLAPIVPLGWGITQHPGVYPSPVEQWTDIGVCMTQRALYTPPEQPGRKAVLGGLVGSVLNYGAASQFAFSVKALFLGCTGSNPSQFCTPQPSRAMDGKSLVRPVPQWTEKFNWLHFWGYSMVHCSQTMLMLVYVVTLRSLDDSLKLLCARKLSDMTIHLCKDETFKASNVQCDFGSVVCTTSWAFCENCTVCIYVAFYPKMI